MLLDFNAAPLPPRLALPVGVGLGKTTAMQRGLVALLQSGVLRGRPVVIGVPRSLSTIAIRSGTIARTCSPTRKIRNSFCRSIVAVAPCQRPAPAMRSRPTL